MADTTSSSQKKSVDWQQVQERLARSAAAIEQTTSPEREHEILTQRAKALARPLRSGSAHVELLHAIAFELGGQRFALDASWVKEVVIPREITRLPGLPNFVRGLVNVRSRVVPAFDLRSLLQLPTSSSEILERLLIVSCDGTEFGLLAEQIAGAVEVPLDGLRREVPGLNHQFLRGIASDGSVLLDLPAIFPALHITEDAS